MIDNNNEDRAPLSNSFQTESADYILGRMFRNLSYECNYHAKYYYPQVVYNNIVKRRSKEKRELATLASGYCEHMNSSAPGSDQWLHGDNGSDCNWDSPAFSYHVDSTCNKPTCLVKDLRSKEKGATSSYPYLLCCSSRCRSRGLPRQNGNGESRNRSIKRNKMEGTEAGIDRGSRETDEEYLEFSVLDKAESVTSEDSVFSDDYAMTNDACEEPYMRAMCRGDEDNSDDADSSFSSAASSTSTLEGSDCIQCGGDLKDELAKDKVICSKHNKTRRSHDKKRMDIKLTIPALSVEGQGDSPVNSSPNMKDGGVASAANRKNDGGWNGSAPQPATSCNDVSSVGSSFHEDREFEFLKAEPVRRTTSLKTYKTPPGTPHRKKGVRFADALGLDLESVRHILDLDDPPEVPKSAMEHLRQGLETDQPSAGVRYLSALFSQPGLDPAFVRRVREGKVTLESCMVDDKDLTISGIVRVVNIDFHKKVLVRFTTNNWLTSADISASYVHNSNDGVTDRFSFSLTVPKYFAVGQRLEMAIVYTSGGQTFWDNNYGKNYAVECYARALPTCEADHTWMHFL